LQQYFLAFHSFSRFFYTFSFPGGWLMPDDFLRSAPFFTTFATCFVLKMTGMVISCRFYPETICKIVNVSPFK